VTAVTRRRCPQSVLQMLFGKKSNTIGVVLAAGRGVEELVPLNSATLDGLRRLKAWEGELHPSSCLEEAVEVAVEALAEAKLSKVNVPRLVLLSCSAGNVTLPPSLPQAVKGLRSGSMVEVM
jgi:hypothetical protein